MDFKEICLVFENLENNSSRLKKIDILSDLLTKIEDVEDLNAVILLTEGRVFPQWSQEKLGFSNKLVIKSLIKSFGINIKKLEEFYKEKGDLGLVGEYFSKNKSQKTLFSYEKKFPLTIQKVFLQLQKIASIGGDSSTDIKINHISELLNSSEPIEVKFLIKIILGDLRIGVSAGSIRDSLLKSIFPEIIGLNDKDINRVVDSNYNVYIFRSIDELKKESLVEFDYIKVESYDLARVCYNFINNSIQEAFDKLNEMSEVVRIAKEKGLKGLLEIDLKVMVPLRAMLMQKVNSINEASTQLEFPFALEYKYDGFRCQVHKKGDTVKLFTRSLEDVSGQFPDVIERVKKNVLVDNIILDGEILGVNSKGEFLPFQAISQRIKRKYKIHELINKLPVVYATWDCMFLNNKSIISKPLFERRKLLIESINQNSSFFVSTQIIINSVESGELFYKKSLQVGNEGVVVKDLNSEYKPGNRVGCWIKIKPIMDPLDVTIVGAQWGEGKRAKWLTSFIIAIKDSFNDSFLTIGKVGSGLKEIESEDDSSYTFEYLTNLLIPLIDEKNSDSKNVLVKPKYVLSVAYEEIQVSSTYSSGFALRFPRIISLREDLNLDDVDDLKKVKQYFNDQ